jgi:hypothetical protein
VALISQPQLFNQRAFDPDALTVTYTNPPTINCGGTQCAPEDCHCQGGDACTSLRCEPDIRTSCINQGRSWCVNMTGAGMTCCVAGYVCNPNGDGCVPGTRTPPPPTRTPTPTPTPTRTPTRPPSTPVASCSNVKIYTPAWAAVTPTMFNSYRAGNQVYFCVSGSTNSTTGSFTKARFRINGVLTPETTLKKPNTNEFCRLYTIPTNVYSFKVEGEVYHSVLGWK